MEFLDSQTRVCRYRDTQVLISVEDLHFGEPEMVALQGSRSQSVCGPKPVYMPKPRIICSCGHRILALHSPSPRVRCRCREHCPQLDSCYLLTLGYLNPVRESRFDSLLLDNKVSCHICVIFRTLVKRPDPADDRQGHRKLSFRASRSNGVKKLVTRTQQVVPVALLTDQSRLTC